MTQRLFQVCMFSSWGESCRVCSKIFVTCNVISSAKREDSVDKESPCDTSVTPGFQNSSTHGNSGLVQWPACSHRQGRDRIPRANKLRRLAESEKLESSERSHFNIYKIKSDQERYLTSASGLHKHKHMPVYTHNHKDTHAHTQTHTCLHTHMYTYTHACTYTYMYTRIVIIINTIYNQLKKNTKHQLKKQKLLLLEKGNG